MDRKNTITKIITKEKSKFIQKFGTNFGTELYNFYRNVLKFGGDTKRRQNNLKLSDRRLMHASEMVSKYNEKFMLSAIKKFNEDLNKGYIYNATSMYFEIFLKKNYQKLINEQNRLKEKFGDEKQSLFEVTPIPKRSLTDTEKQFKYNWIFECPHCNNVIKHTDKTCTQCNALLKWSEVELS